MMRARHLVLTAAVMLCSLPLLAGGDAVMKAMEEELGRSTAKLQMEELSRPYFVSYRVDETTSSDCAATFGSLLRSNENTYRLLTVEVRVGEKALDNTNFAGMPDFGGSMRFYGGHAEMPVDDDERELRRAMWLATDAAYKGALEQLAKKKAALQNKTRTDEIPDFSTEEAASFEATGSVPVLGDPARAEELVRKLSGLFREIRDIDSSQVQLGQSVVVTRYLNSEGSRFVRFTPQVRLLATASTQAVDGMPLLDFVAAKGRSLTDLPPAAELESQVREMGGRLAEMRKAALLETYNGPVLFEGQAAAELLAQAFVPRLLATRTPVADNPQMEAYYSRNEGDGPWVDKIGARVLPRSLSLVDDATLAALGDAPLYGGYPIDDEAVPARRTEVVTNGILKTLLATRNPVRGVANSSGNCRSDGVTPSNLLLTASNGLAPDALRAELQALVEERGLAYGVVVRRIANPMLLMGADPFGSMIALLGGGTRGDVGPAIAAYKVFPDGREELLRNVELADVEASSFKDIVAAGADVQVTTLPFASRGGSPFGIYGGGAGDGPPLVSIATPALLFEELTLKKPSGQVPKPPIAKHPFFEPK